MNLFDDFNLDIVKITKSSGGINPLACDDPDNGSSGGGGSFSCISDCVCHTYHGCPPIGGAPHEIIAILQTQIIPEKFADNCFP